MEILEDFTIAIRVWFRYVLGEKERRDFPLDLCNCLWLSDLSINLLCIQYKMRNTWAGRSECWEILANIAVWKGMGEVRDSGEG